MKPAHALYAFLFCISVGTTILSQFSDGNFLYTVLLSIGCGGIASVSIAWLIDFRNYRQTKKENDCKFSLVMDEYVQIYRRLLFVTVNECHGLYHDQEERSFKEWLGILCDETRYSLHDPPAIDRRCERLSGTVHAIREFLERFQLQSAVLILGGYPNIDKILKFFAVQRVHCRGTLNQLSMGNYKAFCDTTYILYTEFTKMFPAYSKKFPEKYNIHIAKKWDIPKFTTDRRNPKE